MWVLHEEMGWFVGEVALSEISAHERTQSITILSVVVLT